jgi:TonB family protein
LEAPAPLHPPGRIEAVEGELGLGHLGSGLAGSFITPLAAARLAAALAHGNLVRPYWIAQVRDARGDPVAMPEREPPRPVWPAHVAQALRHHMVQVTESGTARRAFLDARGAPRLAPIRVSGKTGTLSGTDPEGLYQWFAGVAPAEAPRVAIAALVVDGPVPASHAAAGVLRELFCDAGSCRPSAVEPLHARARQRDAEARDAIETRRRGERIVQLTGQELDDLYDVTDLDQAPRPVDVTGLDLPRHLRRREARGRIVLMLELSPEGEVLAARIDSSDLPEFDAFVLERVKDWTFTPPTREGRPVHARARLPIPIRVR